MFKTAFLIQTMVLSLLTTPLPDFNFILSFPSHLSIRNFQNKQGDYPLSSISGGKANDLTLNNPPFGEDLPQATSFKVQSTKYKIQNTRVKPQSSVVRTVVIDAGHGGRDPGCLGKKSHEKDIALSIAKKLATAIQHTHPEVKVILTRKTDIFIPLHKRAAIANRNNADLFISIHCNSMPPGNSGTHGTETYVMGLHTATHNLNVAKRENASILLEADYEKNYDYDPNSPEGHIMLSMFQNAYLEQSIQFAEKVEQQFQVVTNRKSRGVKQAGFVVLKETTMPSVLIETGFLSNKKEENYLYTTKGQNSVARAILIAFTDYKKEIEASLDNSITYDFVEAGQAKEVDPQMERSGIPYQRSGEQNEIYYTINESPRYEYNPPVQQKKSPNSAPASYERPTEEILHPSNNEEGYKTYPGIDFGDRSVPTYERPQTYSKGREPTARKVKKKVHLQNGPIRFRVQLAASPYPLDTSSPQWKKTGYMIEIITENNLFKYQARNFGNYHHALEAKMNLRAKGFSDAFIVAYQQGKRIALDEAKKQLGLE